MLHQLYYVMRPPTYQLGPGFEQKLTSFVEALMSASEDIFADEFARVGYFVEMAKADSSLRDDHDLRRTPKQFYLLEAVSYKLYDQVNREGFNRTKETLIILPDCLTLHNPDCRKTDDTIGDECTGCTTECQANEVTQLARQFGATALFSKRKLKDQLQHHAGRSNDIGVIGVACILMLAEGMRTAMELGIPVRGVPLDFTGCEHWNDQPFASRFPLDQLRAILEEKYGTADSPTDSR